MKLSNTLCILCVLSSFFTFHSSFSQNVPSYVPTNGLVGWWPFNGNANDESGNGNHGVVNGALLTEDRYGNSNRSFYFNGSSNILKPNFIFPGGNYTVIFWFLMIDTSVTQRFVTHDWQSGGTFTFSFIKDIGGLKSIEGLHNRDDGSSTFNKVRLFENTASNVWNFCAFIVDGTSIKMFYNGNYVDSTTCNIPISSNQTLFFGGDSFQPVNGKVDDIAIYNRALTQQEITNLYNASVPSPPCNPLPSNLQSGLVGYWPFCGNANDESGNGNHGTVNGATFTTDRFGNANMAYSFDGISNYVRSQNFSSINPTSLTVATWILPYQFGPSENYIINKSLDLNPGNINRNWGIRVNGLTGTISLELKVDNNYFIFSSSQSIATNSWSQITFTYDGNSAKVYCNNLLIISEIVSGLINASNYPLSIGYFPNSQIPPYGYFFNGKIDDICIWNRALDPTEIAQLYQTQSTPSEDGKIGVNIASPQRSLHIKDVIRLEPRNTAPDNPVIGDIYMDGVLKKLRVYDGTIWQNCW